MLLSLVLGFNIASAQTDSLSYDSSFNKQMNAIFDSLNTSKVPFGILRDYAMEFTNLAAYNGLIQVGNAPQRSISFQNATVHATF